MIRWAAYAMIGLGILHMIVLGYDALPVLSGWLRFDLWTFAHTTWPPSARPAGVILSTDAFWSTIGSFALPLILLGCLIVRLDRQNYPIPSFVGWAIGAWALIASLIMEPSGFPLGIVIAILLIVGVRRKSRATGSPQR